MRRTLLVGYNLNLPLKVDRQAEEFGGYRQRSSEMTSETKLGGAWGYRERRRQR